MLRILLLIGSTFILYLGIIWFLLDLSVWKQEEIDKAGEDGTEIQ